MEKTVVCFFPVAANCADRNLFPAAANCTDRNDYSTVTDFARFLG